MGIFLRVSADLSAMAARASLSPAEKAEASFKRGQQILFKARRDIIAKTMMEHPSVIEPLLDKLEQLGYKVKEELEKKAKPKGDQLSEEVSEGLPAKKFEAHPMDLPRCVTKLSQAKQDVLSVCLQQLSRPASARRRCEGC